MFFPTEQLDDARPLAAGPDVPTFPGVTVAAERLRVAGREFGPSTVAHPQNGKCTLWYDAAGFSETVADRFPTCLAMTCRNAPYDDLTSRDQAIAILSSPRIFHQGAQKRRECPQDVVVPVIFLPGIMGSRPPNMQKQALQTCLARGRRYGRRLWSLDQLWQMGLDPATLRAVPEGHWRSAPFAQNPASTPKPPSPRLRERHRLQRAKAGGQTVSIRTYLMALRW